MIIYQQLVKKQYQEPVDDMFDDITDITLGSNDSLDEESSKQKAPEEGVKDVSISEEEHETAEINVKVNLR